MLIQEDSFGCTQTGSPAHLFSIQNHSGMTAILSDYGAILVRLLVPCSDGLQDVVLGYDTLREYENGGFFGATVGRHANRIAGAAFTLDGVEYRLCANDLGNNLHTDFRFGFHKQLWQTELLQDGVRFYRTSPDGEAGFPGNLDISVFYTLDEANGLHIRYEGITDRKTLVNLTNHSFFNLNGHDNGRILNHETWLFSDSFLEIDKERLPTGMILPVEGTAMDFRRGKPIYADFDLDLEQIRFARGYDHCYVTDAAIGELKKIALFRSPDTGIGMEVSTDLPGFQFYTANFLPVQNGKGDAVYGPQSGFCVETQYFPDSIHFPSFPQCVFGPGEAYRAETVYRFLSTN